MPWWIRTFVYRIRFAGIKIHHSVEIEQKGFFSYHEGCVVSKNTNLVINQKARLSLSSGIYIGRNVEIGADDIQISSDVSIQDRCVLLGSIKIGCGCILAPNIFITSGGHHFDLRPYLPIREQDAIGIKSVKHKPVVIEDDCWLGINVVVMPGVIIGKGSVIGAGAIVTKSIPPYSVCVGAPAMVIRKRLEFCLLGELSPSDELSLPCYYSGFKHNVINGIRHIFVSELSFAFALLFSCDSSIEILFINHSRRQLKIRCGEMHFTLSQGDNSIAFLTAYGAIEDAKISFLVEDESLNNDELEVASVKVKN